MSKWICWSRFKDEKYWGFWFRVFGYGVAVTNMTPLFSERMKVRKVIRVFGIKIELLKPSQSTKGNNNER